MSSILIKYLIYEDLCFLFSWVNRDTKFDFLYILASTLTKLTIVLLRKLSILALKCKIRLKFVCQNTNILFIVVLGIYDFQFIQSYAGHNVTSKQNSKLLLRWHSSKKSKDYCLVRLTGWLIIELRFKLGTRPWDFKGEIVWPWGFNYLNYVLKIWNLAIWDRPLNSI